MSSLSNVGSKKSRTEDVINKNPYLNAARTWNEHTGSIINSRQIWQAVALICMMTTLGAVAGVIYIGSQSKFVPYIVHVNNLGQVAAVGRADRVANVDNLIHAAVADFVINSRMVSFDRNVQHDAIWKVYAMMQSGDPAAMKMTAFMKEETTSPTLRATKESVSVEISSVLQQTPETWEVNWAERVWDREGNQTAQLTMRGLITVYVSKPTTKTTEEEIRRNPLGMFVKDFSWSRVIGD